jgi:hypothetical protein
MKATNNCYFKSLQIFILLIFFFTACTQPDKYNIVTFKGKGSAFNISKSSIYLISKSDSFKTANLMAGENDLLAFEDYMLVYHSIEGNEYKVSTDSIFGYVNNHLYSLFIVGGENSLAAFMKLKDSELESLKFINFKDSLFEIYKPLLLRLSKVNPHVGCNGKFFHIKEALKYLQPEVVVLDEMDSKDISFLENLKTVKVLCITLSGSSPNIQIPSLPSLTNLFVDIECDDNLIKKDFLEKNF